MICFTNTANGVFVCVYSNYSVYKLAHYVYKRFYVKWDVFTLKNNKYLACEKFCDNLFLESYDHWKIKKKKKSNMQKSYYTF